MKLIIIRGPSGSGKSTIAYYLQGKHNAPCHEADSFFEKSWYGDGTRETGYQFDASKLSQAHKWCQLNVEKHMIEKVPTIVVSNTSMSSVEVGVYADLAKNYNYEVEVWRTPAPWNPDELHARNKHEVPLETIRKQIRRYRGVVSEQEWTNMEIFE
jgi:predicted kinase